jgi:DNA-binding MarR family transcriptional regulator
MVLKPNKNFINLRILTSIMDKKNRRFLLLISIPAIIGFVIVFFLNIIERPEEIASQPLPPTQFRGEYRRIPIIQIFLSPILLIIAVIPISYYFISQRLEEKLEKNLNVISKLIEKNNSVSNKSPTEINDKNIVLKFLNPSERKVVEKLIERKGKTLQSEISQMEGMSKLKTHRAVKDLERKGIIVRESYGKTNRIILSKDIKDLMFKG